MTNPNTAQVEDRFLRLPDVTRLLGVTKPTIYLWIKQGRFPRAVKVGPNSAVWPESEVRAFMRARLAARDQAA